MRRSETTMERLTEKEWFPIRVAYGRERCTAQQLAERGYRCWLPACPHAADRSGGRRLWVRSLLFVGTREGHPVPSPCDALPFRFLAAESAQRPLSLDAQAMQRLVDAFAAGDRTQALAAAFGTPGAGKNPQL